MSKITELQNMISVDSAVDVLPIVDVSEGTTKKIVPNELFNSVLDIESGIMPVEVLGLSAEITGECSYYKIGKLVFTSFALWFNNVVGTDETFRIKLPFKCSALRAHGVVGFNTVGDNIHAVISSADSDEHSSYVILCNDKETITYKGNQIPNSSIQLSIVYPCV